MNKDRLTIGIMDRPTFAATIRMTFTPRIPMVLASSTWRNLVAGMALLVAGGAQGQATDLIISEYVEGSANNKYIELYNGTAAVINLADYELRLYANGAATPGTTNALSGSLAPGATIVYRNSAATIYLGATTIATVCNFNGDDAIALWKVSTTSFVDIVGNIGCDPGPAWTATGISTLDRSLVRNANICAGVALDPAQTPPANTNILCPFPTLASEWTNNAIDVVANLGSHTMTCGPTVTMAVATSSALESVGAHIITLNISPAAPTAESVVITVTNGPGAIHGAGNDYTTAPATVAGVFTRSIAAGATTATFAVNVNDDIMTEANEVITFTITSASAGLSLGSTLAHAFTITNNDVTPTVNFTTASIAALENTGTQTFSFSINPAAPAGGSFTVAITNGPGACYGFNPCDYFTAPAQAAGIITVTYLAGATTASFNATLINDLNPELTEQVSFSISGVAAGFAIGSDDTRTLTIGDNDSPPTVLDPGDLVVVGVDASSFACNGNVYDYVSFFCFKPIVPGTEIIITDNGFERVNAGLWGNSEGTVRMVRTGIALPAGQVITFEITGVEGAGNVVGIAPDAGWTCTDINNPVGSTFPTPIAINNGGDQLFFMQGAAWNSGTGPANVFAHNASYTGRILYAFSTNPTFPWVASNSTQRSNLPAGVSCFSMAPTLATDFNKYTGSLAARSQRDWIIDIDNTANWSSYANCAGYNSAVPNWLTAPILPITVAPFVAGRWRGSTSTDWFDCKNWDDVTIPTLATPVVIDPTWAARNCEVGLVPASAAECASILQNSGAAARNLIVRNGSTLTIDGPLTINRNVVAGALTTSVLDNSQLNCSTLAITGVTAGAINEAIFRCDAGGIVRVEDDLTIGIGGLFDLQGAVGASGTLLLGGDWINLEDELKFQEQNSLVVMNGNVDQTLTTVGPEVFGSLRLQKTGGDLVLNSPIDIRTELDLSVGRIMNTATELVSMRAGSVASNASDISFVHGPVQKLGNTPFTFPVGKGPNLRPCGLSGITGGASSGFTAEYFPISAYTWGFAMEPTLDHVSDCEYWIIDRSAGAGNAVVELTWDTPESCGVTDPTDLRVVRWDAALNIWQDRGNGGATPLAPAGTIPTAAVQTLFSPWTLSSINNQNPLPISLVEFTAKPEGANVRLDWVTASEQDNAYFTVERSADGSLFAPVLERSGAGNSTQLLHYTDLDLSPLSGLSYYRLKQTDTDGTFAYSNTVSVVMGSTSDRPLVVFGTAERITALHGFPAGSRYSLLDMTGRLVLDGVVTTEGSFTTPLPGLQRGAYLLRVQDGERMESTRFVY
jgi:hypothetical protein